jgi:hypothetical protein
MGLGEALASVEHGLGAHAEALGRIHLQVGKGVGKGRAFRLLVFGLRGHLAALPLHALANRLGECGSPPGPGDQTARNAAPSGACIVAETT